MQDDDAPIPIELQPSAQIRVSADGTWEPDPEGGFDALLLPVRVPGGAIIDTVAWEFGHPWQWWMRRGVATFLGEYEIERVNAISQPARLVPMPADYLKHDGYAVCILNWQADIRAILSSCQHGIMCSTEPLMARVAKIVNSRPADRLNLTVAG